MARLASFSCVNLNESKRCANKILDKMSDEQKKKFGITDENKNSVHGAITQVVQVHAGAAPDLDVQERILQDIDGFLSYLEDKILQKEFLEENMEDALKDYEGILRRLNTAFDGKQGRMGIIDVSDWTEDNLQSLRTILSSQNGLVQTYDRYEEDKNAKNGKKTVQVVYIIKEPVKSKEKSPQQKALDRIKTLKEKKGAFISREYVDESGKLQYTKDNNPPKGWMPTGRSKYLYEGKEIITTSVTIDSDKFNPTQSYPLAAGPIGTFVDNALRIYFNKDYRHLWDEDGNLTKSDENLQWIINNELGGIFTLKGFKAFLKDCQEMEKKIKKHFGEDAITYTDKLTMFSKTFDDRGEEMWLTGQPDLLVIDKNGVVHVIDFKSLKMRSVNEDVHGFNPYNEGFKKDEYGRNIKYGKQLSRYISMLESFGFSVDLNPYVIQIDTYYDSSDSAVPLNLNEGEFQKGKTFIISNGNKYKPKDIKIQDPESGEIVTLGEYVKRNGNPTRENIVTGDGHILYIEPRLHVREFTEKGFSDDISDLRTGEDEIPSDRQLSFEMQVAALSKEEKEAMTWFGGKVIHKSTSKDIKRLSEDDIASRPEIVGPDEIQRTANYLMHAVSKLIDDIDKYGKVSKVYTKKRDDGTVRVYGSEIGGEEYKGRGHAEIIRLIGLQNILNHIFDKHIATGHKENFPLFQSEEEYKAAADKDGVYEDDTEYFESWQDYKEQKHRNDARGWYIQPKHREQFFMAGYNKLMALEDSVVPETRKDTSKPNQETANYTNFGQPIKTDDIQQETGDDAANQSFAEKYEEGLKDLEAWMMGQRNYSPKASLSKEIKRMFEEIVLIKEDGKPVLDPYGYGFLEHLDSATAVQSILDICKDCETIEEMESALKAATKNSEYLWVQQVLDKINLKENENLRAKFFRHFRKDYLSYSICEVKFNKKTGDTVIRTRIINRKSAYETITQSLGVSFNEGKVGKYWHPEYSKGKSDFIPLISREGEKNVFTYFNQGSKKQTVANLILADIGDENGRSGWLSELQKIWKSYRSNSGMTREDYVREELMKKRRNGMNAIEAITNILNGIGILIPQEVVFNLCVNDVQKGWKTSGAASLLLGAYHTITHLSTLNARSEGIPNGLAGNPAFSNYAPLLQKVASYVQEKVEASVYQDGKTYYSYSNPSRLGHIIRNLKDSLQSLGEKNPVTAGKFLNYIHDQFGRYEGWYKSTNENEWLSDWVEQFATSEASRNALEHKVELSFVGSQYRDLGELGFLRSILHNYLGSEDDDPNWRWFALPTMSNKPTNEFIRMKKYADNDAIIDKVLMKTFKQEINRMADVLFHFARNMVPVQNMDIQTSDLEKIFNPKNKKELKEETTRQIQALKDRIDNRQITRQDLVTLSKVTSGAKFHFLWYLNSEIADNEDFGDMIADRINNLLTPQDQKEEENLEAEINFEDTVRDTIESHMEKIVQNELDEMERIGLFDLETKKGSATPTPKYIEEFYISDKRNFGKTLDDFKRKVKDYIWQDIAANINIIQITGGDLAYYGNAVEYQKRIAQIHSPGLHLMHDARYDDGYLRSVHVSDSKAISEVVNNAEVALGRIKRSLPTEQQHDFQQMINVILKGFSKINITDGQSFTSITAMRKKLKLMGEWTEEHETAWREIRNGKFDINHLSILMQPMKPFVTSDMAKYSGSPTMTLRRVPLQDKNSEYLLIIAEALSTGAGMKSKMKAIHDFMEETQKFGDGRQGIDTVHFKSVGKVGVSGIIDMDAFDETYTGSDEDYVNSLKEYMLEHVRQNNPTKKSRQSKADHDAQNKLSKTTKDAFGGDVSGKLKSAEIIYNSQYVDTIPVDDYIIQQEVPAHLLDRKGMLYGSQIRILGISDITPGTEFDVKGERMPAEKLIQEYKELHAKNIDESYVDILKEMGLDELVEINEETGEVISMEALEDLDISDPRRNNVYVKLETLLQKELCKDAKYGFDARRACKLRRDDQGNVIDFEVPLMDPIQSRRIQMLLNSIIKKEINKQRIDGGPVVQATAYDNDLNIRFKDKKGNILMSFSEWKAKFAKSWQKTQGDKQLPKDDELAQLFREQYLEPNQAGIAYFECYMSIPNKALEKLLTKDDGTMMSFKEAEAIFKDKQPEVWRELTEVIGYRIPTEDKYSILPLKIVGFVPKAAGEVIMMPKEITLLTGSDFDIDKLYVMRKAFRMEYVDETQYGVTDETVKKIITNYPNLVKIKKNQISAIKKIIRNGNKMINPDLKGVFRLSDGLTKEEKKELSDFLDWYRAQLLLYSFGTYEMDSKNKKHARKARNNRLIDLQWAVLTNEDTSSKMLNPGNFDPQKKTGRLIRVIKDKITKPGTNQAWTWEELSEMSIEELDNLLENANHHSTTLPSSKLYFQRQNMQGSQMVGIFANNNVSHAFMTFQKVGIDLLTNGIDNTFNFEGVLIGNHAEPTVLDPQKGRNGQLISKTIASFLAAAVDTAKDPTLSDMNISTFTGSVAMVLARLGFDTESIGLFLSQPIIMELSDIFFKNRTDGYYDGDKAMRELASQLDIPFSDIENKSAIRDGSLTKEEMIKHLTNSEYRKDPSQKDYQLRVLRGFHSLFKIAQDLQELTFCTKFNSVNNAVGPTIADTIEDEERVKKFMTRCTAGTTVFYNPEKEDYRGYTSADQVIENDPILKSFYDKTLGLYGASRALFSHFFPHYYPGFNNVLEYFKENYLNGNKIDSKLYNQLLDEYLYYLLTYEDKNGLYKPTLPYDKKSKDYLVKDLIKRFEDVQKIKGRRPNMLLDESLAANCLRVRKADEFIATDILVFNSSALGAEAQENLKIAWSELITMNDPNLTPKQNSDIRRFGIDLFFYTMMRNGFGFSPKTLMHLASTIVRMNAVYEEDTFNYYLDGLRELRTIDRLLMGQKIDDGDNFQRFLNQFIRNHANNKRIVPNIKGSSRHILSTLNSDEVVFGVEESKLHELKVIRNNKPYKFISVTVKSADNKLHTNLYTLADPSNPITSDEGMSKVRYIKINVLGFVNNFIEYNANEDIEKSFFEEIRGASANTFDEDNTSQDDTDTKERMEGDEVVGESENGTDVANNLVRIMQTLEGPQKTSKKVRKKLVKAFKDARRNRTELADMFLSLLDAKSQDEQQQSMNRILEHKTVKSLLEEVNDQMNKQNRCK